MFFVSITMVGSVFLPDIICGFSTNLQSFLIFGIVLAVVFVLIQYKNRPKNLPPGPKGVPIFGVLLKLGSKPYKTVQSWWDLYGDVYSIYMGSRLCIVLNGHEIMRECLVKHGDIFSNRPWNYFKKLARNKGIVFTDGIEWKEHRRFTLSCMRDFGMGKISLEAKIHDEIVYLVGDIEQYKGQPFNPGIHIPKAVSNIISSIIYGSRFDYEDEVFKANVTALDQSVRKQSLLGMIQFLPFLEILPKVMPKDKLLLHNVKLRDAFANQKMDEHKETFDPESPRDYIDAYLINMMNSKAAGKTSTFDEAHLQRTIQDLFIAGTETVNTTLKWSVLFMASYPEIQKRVQEEIDMVLGSSRFPKMTDKQFMPYTDATICECQRLGNIALFSVPRCTTKETVVNGYTIPKGAWVFVNRWGAHMNTRYWKDPYKFDPTRFIDKDGKVFKPDAFIPFGMGPRSCLGEVLAKMELFLFFTSLLQHFTLETVGGQEKPSLEPQAGINMSPQQYEICAKVR